MLSLITEGLYSICLPTLTNCYLISRREWNPTLLLWDGCNNSILGSVCASARLWTLSVEVFSNQPSYLGHACLWGPIEYVHVPGTCMTHVRECSWLHTQTCVCLRPLVHALLCVCKLPKHLVWICPCFRPLAGQGSGRRYQKSLLFSQGWWESQGLSLRQWNHPPFPLL